MTFKEWLQEDRELDEIRDIAERADAGWPGLTYYTDTVALYDRFEDDIWQALYEDAEAFGHKHPLEMVATFSGAQNVADSTTFKNLLVWYMAERTAREIADEAEATA